MSRYDRSLTVFSPDGHLLQVEYAMEAVKKGAAVVGVQGKDAVVIAVERRAVPKLQDPRTLDKIFELDDHLTLAFAGFQADARVLVNEARLECLRYKMSMGEQAPVDYVARQVAQLQQDYTQRRGVRPFGISTVIAGFSPEGNARLFSTDPSGIFSQWKAHALGRNDSSLKEFLEKHYKDDMPESDSVKLAVRTLLEIVESGSKSMEILIRRSKQPAYMMPSDEIQSYVDQVEKEKEEEEANKRGGTSGAAAP